MQPGDFDMKAAGSGKTGASIRTIRSLRSTNVFRVCGGRFQMASLIGTPATWKRARRGTLIGHAKSLGVEYAKMPGSLRWMKAIVASKASFWKIDIGSTETQ